MQINGVVNILKSNGVVLNVTDNAVLLLTEEGYDPEFGARPVKRAIQRMLLNQLSKDILAQKINRMVPITIDSDGEQLVFKN